MRRMPPPAWYSQSTYSLNIIPEEHIPPADYDDVVHKEVGESLDRRGKPLAASAYNLNLTPPLAAVDGLSKENLIDVPLTLDMRRSCHDISTPRTSSEKTQFFSRPFRGIPLKRTKSVSKLEKVTQP
ncbi:hypothetical protein OSTOST_01330, partial [Ostertagia ostertagi]